MEGSVAISSVKAQIVRSIKDNSKNTLLNCLDTVAMCDSETTVPNRACVFEDWSNDGSIEMV